MCGIFGAFTFKEKFSPDQFLNFCKLTDMVSYRGPNGAGYCGFDAKQGKSIQQGESFDVFLGHRRLSIIDLSENGKQPLSIADQSLWIIFNGEIFNYVELRDELVCQGVHFQTKTDTEVILHLYQKYGAEGFAKLNGMWAFAILDCKNAQLILSRDRFSIKPLYYYQTKDAFYFASEIKQLLPLLSKREPHLSVLVRYLDQGLIDDTHDTFFTHIKKVPAKTNVIIDIRSHQMTQSPYWNYHDEEVGGDEMEMMERFRELFFDSVRIRLRSDVKVGALLSGGLDSTAISVVAHHLQQGKFETYSVISKEKKYSEEKFIDQVRATGIKNCKIAFEAGISRQLLEKVLYHHDEPCGGLSTVAQYNVLKALKNETDIIVVLSGQGGDEILLGYLKYYFFYLRGLIQERKLLEVARQGLASLVQRTMLWQFRLDEAMRYIPALHTVYPKNYLLMKADKMPVWRCDNMRERQIADIDRYSVPALTHYEDRNSMAHSLEIRLPFLDHRLVNFTLNLPTKMKLRNGWSKYILRKSLHEMPAGVRWRRDKKGFSIPEGTYLKDYFSGFIREIFQKSVLADLGIVNDKSFLQYYEQFRNGKGSIWNGDISKMMFAELWARQTL